MALFANDMPPPSLKSRVPEIAPRSVFFVYGEKGQGGTETKPNRGFYEAAREPKQVWEVPNGQHIAGITTEPEKYERRVIAFLDDALLGKTMTASTQNPPASGSTATSELAVPRSQVLTETVVARVALGLIALHVVDDNFLQPQPGTSAGDHLVSGLVPLGVLVLVAWGYPRLRAGLRAVLALFFGIFGIVTGVEAGYYSTKGGPTGDDFTGFLALAAGIVLIVLAFVTLWRSRKTGGSRTWRYLRRTLLAVGGLAVVYLVMFPLSFSYVLTHVARGFVPEPELGAAYEDVSFRTSDGLELEGWYIPSKNRAAVIAFPGRSGSQRPARMLARHGYGVLLFDRRGEGESDGDPNIFGWKGERDVTPRSSSCATARTSTRSGSAASDSPSGAR